MAFETRFERYNMKWIKGTSDLEVEIVMIQKGGQWVKKKDGQTAGNGLAWHWRRFQELVWPEKEWHKWSILQMECYLKYSYIAEMAPASAGKTYNISTNLLTDYFCFPYETTIMLTTTQMERAEEKIWGCVKDLFNKAIRRWPELPGRIINGKYRIVSDDSLIEREGTDFRNGVVVLPAKVGNVSIGLSPFIGAKRGKVRLAADECFVAGTLVDTPSGPVPIEQIKEGDKVMNAVGEGWVLRTSNWNAIDLVTVKMKNGREITCTPNHPFFTQKGWKKACDLNEGCYILSAYESMSLLSRPTAYTPTEKFLQSVLSIEVEAPAAGAGKNLRQNFGGVYQDAQRAPRAGGRVLDQDENQSPTENPSSEGQALPCFEGNGMEAESAWRKWNRAYQGGIRAYENVSASEMELRGCNTQAARERVSAALQGGRGVSRHKAGRRGGRKLSLRDGQEAEGRQENSSPGGSWVDSVTFQKLGNSGASFRSPNTAKVYNFQVTGHPSYSVHGLLVHNCNLLPKTFIDSFANLNKNPDFKAWGAGNPKDTTDALGFMAEPAADLGGWDSGIDQTPKTKTWRTKMPNGICIHLPGGDSPNNDFPDDAPKFKALINRAKMKADAQIWGVTDWHYKMFDEGILPKGMGSRRVLTRQMAITHHALDDPKWRDHRRTLIASLDAAYQGVGGDQCIFTVMAFGPEAPQDMAAAIITENLLTQNTPGFAGRTILALMYQKNIPIETNAKAGPAMMQEAEDQIVYFCKKECEGLAIPPANFFFDSGMRVGLVTAFARQWSPEVNAVDCGGLPSDERVSDHIDMQADKYFSKRITQLWWDVRFVVEAGQFRGMTEEPLTELCAREWKMVSGNRIEVESKMEFKAKLGYSPDAADSLVVGVMGARKRGFVIARPEILDLPKYDQAWKRKVQEQSQKAWHSKALTFAK